MDLFSGIGRGLEDLAKQAKDVGKKVNIGAKEASKNTRIKIQLKEMEMKIQEAYERLGKTYYMEMRSQSHKTESSSAETLYQLDDLHVEKEALENLLKYKEINGENKDGPLRCFNCQEEIGEGAKFCSNCGEAVKTEVEIIEADLVEEVECPNCYYMAKKGSSFCPRCGSRI